MSSPWSRMDSLLKCSVCSERFRNPKLLPCNHTFCAEPCLSKFVAQRQMRCPECSAEHRVPAQGFPHNVTLGRFLELRQQVSGVEPELPASMQRCNACKEKGRLEACAHCNRKICVDCKAAHVNILRKEIALINGQVREGLKLLSNALHTTEENAEKLQKNYSQVKDEIEEVVRRYTCDLLNTEAKLKHNLDLYLKSELRSMRRLEHDLQIELTNVNSNCDLVDKFVNNGVEWTDAELTDYKEIFMKTLDFLRAFDADPTDCVRKVKFHPRADPDQVHKTLVDFAEVKLNEETPPPPAQPPAQEQSNNHLYSSNSNLSGPTVTLTPPLSALSRSQSDHKLARKRGGQMEDLEPPPPPQSVTRRFRDRFTRDRDSCERELSPTSTWRRELEEVRRGRGGFEEDDPPEAEPATLREVGVSGTEDATKGPLSGVIRILDSPHVMERLHNSEIRQKKEKEEEERRAKMPKRPAPPPVSRPMNRQLSEDEIEKQKKENKAAAAAASNATPKVTSEPRTPKPSVPDEPPSRPSYTSRTPAAEPRTTPRTEEPPKLRSWRTTSSAATERDVSQSPPGSPTRNQKPPVSPRAPPNPVRQSRFLPRPSSLETAEDPPSTPERPSSPVNSRRSTPTTPTTRPHLRLAIRAEPSSSSSSSSESESETEEVDSETAVKRGDISPSVNTLLARSAQARKQSASTQARIMGRPEDRLPRPDRNAPAGRRSWRDSVREDDEDLARIRERNRERDSLASSRRKTSITEPDPTGRISPYSRFLERRRSSVNHRREKSPEESRRSRLARSKSSHDLHPDSPDSPTDEPPAHNWSQYMRNKYGAGLVRSRTAASLVAAESSDEEAPVEDNGAPAGRRRDYQGSSVSPRGFSAPRRTYMQKGKSSFRFGTRGSEKGCFTWPRGVCVGNDNTIVVADSNNHRVQVFNSTGKCVQEFGSYGSGDGEFDCLAGVTVNRIGQFIVSDRYNHRLQVFDPSGRFIRAFGCEGRMDGKFSYPWGVATDNLGFIYVCDKENHRIQVFQGDGTYVTKFGGIGQRPGELEHPHYVAVSSTNRVIVSDSNNHRVQIFDVNGRLLSTFGTEGSEEGQFKYPRGVAVDDQGYLFVGDSGNNRIQIFHPDGTFLKAFGTWGSGEGEFKGLEGIAVSPTGQILACDRENHRIQVF